MGYKEKEKLKSSLFVTDVMLYLKDPKTPPEKLDLINPLCKLAKYKLKQLTKISSFSIFQ
jgi:hypothetical protein